MSNAKLSSNSVEHLSPEAVAKATKETLGRIDLDPASCFAGNLVIGAERYFTFMDNGLKQEWNGNVFLNPPGGTTRTPGAPSRSRQVLWWVKLAREWEEGRTAAAVFLGFSIEILQTAQQVPGLQPMDFPICIPSQRLRYDVSIGGGDKHRRVSQDSPTHANVIVHLPGRDDPKGERFREAFAHIGKVK